MTAILSRGDELKHTELFSKFYMRNTKAINNGENSENLFKLQLIHYKKK